MERNTPSKESLVYINFSHPIIPEKVQALMAGCTQAIGQFKPDRLYILFASPGGFVDPGINLYNFLKALPVKITMHNMGSINSIANVIFMAGEERYAVPHSSFLFHGVATQFKEKSSLTLSQLNEKVSSLAIDQEKIAGILAENTKLTDKKIRELFNQGESTNTSFAKKNGIIHNVCEAKIRKGVPLIGVN
jgi:ATP-dependent protease ClpP protease subunit